MVHIIMDRCVSSPASGGGVGRSAPATPPVSTSLPRDAVAGRPAVLWPVALVHPSRIVRIPAFMSAWAAIATPSAVMVAEDVSGSHRVISGPFPSTRVIRRRA